MRGKLWEFPSPASKPDVEAIVRTGVAAAAMPPEDGAGAGAGAGAVGRTAGRDGWRVAAEEDRRPKASERRRSAARERERILNPKALACSKCLCASKLQKLSVHPQSTDTHFSAAAS